MEPGDFRHIIESMMVLTAARLGLNTDFEKLVNPTGRFVIGGPFADCGVTGWKLACDTYGSVGHIGGGSCSGKDPSKVDRSGAYIARKIARDIVRAGYADKAEVQIAYAIGVAEPVSVHVDCFGTEKQSQEFLEGYIRDNYDLTLRGIINTLHLLEVDYNRVSAYAWQKASKQYLAAHPLCVKCMAEGRYVRATVVDHIVPHRGDKNLFRDRSNWQSLCKAHHDKKTGLEDSRPTYHF